MGPSVFHGNFESNLASFVRTRAMHDKIVVQLSMPFSCITISMQNSTDALIPWGFESIYP